MTLAILEGVCSDKKLSTIDQLYEYRYIIAMELIFLRYLFILTFSSGNERDGGEARKMKMKKKNRSFVSRFANFHTTRHHLYLLFPLFFFFCIPSLDYLYRSSPITFH